MNFDEAFNKLLGHEGGYVDHPDDPGGATRWGITERVARANGYTGRMQDLPQETAKVIARREYWDAAQVDSMPALIRYSLFDTAYNSGVKQAIRLLQRAVYTDADGILGPKTLMAAQSYSPAAVAARFAGHRAEFLTDLKNWPSFGEGWTRRLASILIEVKG